MSERLGIRNRLDMTRYLARAVKLAELWSYYHPDHRRASENDVLAFLA